MRVGERGQEGGAVAAANQIKRARRAALSGLVFVSLANFFNYFDRSIFNLMLVPIRKEFALDNTQIGLLSGAFALLFALMSLPLAWAADKTRRLTVMGGAIAIWSLATAASGLATGFTQLFAARIVVGAGEAGCLPAGTSLIADHYPPARRPGAMAVYQGSGLLGAMLGLMIVGVLADHVGWRLSLIYASLPGLLLAPVAWLLREPQRGRFDSAERNEQSWGSALLELSRSRVYLTLLVAITCVSLGFSTLGAWGPSFFVRQHGLSLSTVGVFFGLSFGLSAAAGTFIGGYVTSRLVARNGKWEFWVPAAAYGFAVPLYELAFNAHSADMAFVFTGAASFTAFLGYGPTMSLYHVVAPPAARATAVSVGACVAGIAGAFSGPVAIGVLTDALTPRFGQDALRIALELLVLCFLVPAALYALAGRKLAIGSAAATGNMAPILSAGRPAAP